MNKSKGLRNRDKLNLEMNIEPLIMSNKGLKGLDSVSTHKTLKYCIKFLFKTKTETVILDSKALTLFYQNKLNEVNIISVKKIKTQKPNSDISKFVKAKESIWV